MVTVPVTSRRGTGVGVGVGAGGGPHAGERRFAPAPIKYVDLVAGPAREDSVIASRSPTCTAGISKPGAKTVGHHLTRLKNKGVAVRPEAPVGGDHRGFSPIDAGVGPHQVCQASGEEGFGHDDALPVLPDIKVVDAR